MEVQYVRLSDDITARISPVKVQELVRKATETGLTGEELWSTLVYSGAALGIDELQRHYTDIADSQFELMREMSTKLDVALTLLDEPGSHAYKTVQSLYEMVHANLKDRAKALAGQHIAGAVEMYGLDEAQITGSTPPESMPAAELQRTGFAAFRRQMAYFFLWGLASADKAIPTMKCRCQNCMFNLRRGSPALNESEVLERITEHFGDMGKAFEGFAVFLINETRESLENDLQGTRGPHEIKDGEDAEKVAKDFMSSLMAKTKKKDEE